MFVGGLHLTHTHICACYVCIKYVKYAKNIKKLDKSGKVWYNSIVKVKFGTVYGFINCRKLQMSLEKSTQNDMID